MLVKIATLLFLVSKLALNWTCVCWDAIWLLCEQTVPYDVSSFTEKCIDHILSIFNDYFILIKLVLCSVFWRSAAKTNSVVQVACWQCCDCICVKSALSLFATADSWVLKAVKCLALRVLLCLCIRVSRLGRNTPASVCQDGFFGHASGKAWGATSTTENSDETCSSVCGQDQRRTTKCERGQGT